jgi:hypothetical protein
MLEDLLNPEVLRPKLIVVSLYIAAFQLLKNAIIEPLESFFTMGGLPQYQPKYKAEVLSRNRSVTYASLNWLKENEVIDTGDTDAFEEMKELRNDLAHRISGMLEGELPSELPERFHQMVDLLTKIGRWWIVNVEMETPPTDETKVIPGSIIGLQLMVDVALGSEGDSRKYLEAFRKLQEFQRLKGQNYKPS